MNERRKELGQLVFEISRMAIHNGPGIRTMVHFKGCPLRCAWCSTPESQPGSAQLTFSPEKCIGCGQCIKSCPDRCLYISKNGTAAIRWDLCSQCLACVPGCCTKALSIAGKGYTKDELFREILKDKVFFNTSGGGVTFSGGEPLMAVREELLALLVSLKKAEISIGFDTCGYVPWENIEAVLPYTDFFLWDMKVLDSHIHRKVTGVGNERILENLKKTDDLFEGDIYIRCPIIPGINDNDGHFEQLVHVLKEIKHIKEIHLIPLHHLGTSRYKKIGKKDAYENVETLPEDYLAGKQQMLELAGFVSKIIG